jgi:hypothetical protein
MNSFWLVTLSEAKGLCMHAHERANQQRFFARPESFRGKLRMTAFGGVHGF